MTIRMVFYDISIDKCRSKLAQKLEAWGFLRMQYSVFCGKHTTTQWKHCWQKIQHIVAKYGNGTEKIYVIILSPSQLLEMKTIGDAPEVIQILNEKITMWV